MRIRGESAPGGELAAEVMKLVGADPPLNECAGVHAGRTVPLKVNHVGGAFTFPAAEKMIEPDLIERGGGRVGGDMPAETGVHPVRLHNHRHRIPADIALDPPFDLPVSRIGRFFLGGDRIHVGGPDESGKGQPRFPQVLVQLLEGESDAPRFLVPERRLEYELKRRQPPVVSPAVPSLRERVRFLIFSFHHGVDCCLSGTAPAMTRNVLFSGYAFKSGSHVQCNSSNSPPPGPHPRSLLMKLFSTCGRTRAVKASSVSGSPPSRASSSGG